MRRDVTACCPACGTTWVGWYSSFLICAGWTLSAPKSRRFRTERRGFNWRVWKWSKGFARVGQCAVFASAHLANWEIGALVLTRAGMPMTYVYRQADNPWADDVIQSFRLEDAEFVRKRHAGRALVDALRRGRSVGVVNDQKLTEGPLVDFLGVPAGTAPVAASLALRAGLPVFPLRVERTGGAAFRVTVEPALPTPAERGTRRERTMALLRSLNARYSDWIRARPEQWLWIHRRWPAG